ncbi:MAG: hypothetical protein EXR77_18495 [Myxococcales bacterium]|nr:hypothetical protein [Myxococcales bacterium]
MAWLKAAQDSAVDRGVARGFSIGWSRDLKLRGWQPSYPETTGYIIPTLFDCSAYLNDADLRRRAIQMADWEISVQLPSGAVMGGTVNRPRRPAVFNTGQVMLGWLRAAAETGDQRYVEASSRAAHFLVHTQDADGGWSKGNSTFANATSTTYNSRVGWALLVHGAQTGDGAARAAGERNIAFTLGHQNNSGWFTNNCLDNPSAPLTHTISYALEGILGANAVQPRPEYVAAVRKTLDSLLPMIGTDGRIAGRFDASWKPTVTWSCLTGSAQLAGMLLQMAKLTGEVRYREAGHRTLAFVKSTQDCGHGDAGIRGGIAGSFPIDGDYGKYEILNWPTKFFVDALLINEKVA